MTSRHCRHYRLIDHTADFGMEVFGADPAGVFANAALAVFDLVAAGVSEPGRERLAVEIKGQDWCDLMVNWLREMLYLWNGRRQLGRAITIERLSDTELRAEVALVDYNPRRHRVRQEIKAVTYHQIAVEPTDAGWRARVIFDV